MVKIETRGRKKNKYPSRSFFVRCPYSVSQTLIKFCKERKQSYSSVIVEALKYFLGIG